MEDELLIENDIQDIPPELPTDSPSTTESEYVTVYADNVTLLSNGIESYAVGDNNGYQLPTYYVEYFKGVVDNLGDTDYLAFATREYASSGYNTYTEHYTLIYDIEVQDNEVISGIYPCIDIYRESANSYYIYNEGTYNLISYPSFSYGSFGNLSSLGKGDLHNAILSISISITISFLCMLIGKIFFSIKRH